MDWGEGIKTCSEDVIAVTHTWASPEMTSSEETVVLEALSQHFPRNSFCQKAMSEEYQKLKWHWDAPPFMVLACGPQGLQRSRLPSLNQKTCVLFLVEKNWLNFPHPSFPFWKGKEALNFVSPYITPDGNQGLFHKAARGVMRHKWSLVHCSTFAIA